MLIGFFTQNVQLSTQQQPQKIQQYLRKTAKRAGAFWVCSHPVYTPNANGFSGEVSHSRRICKLLAVPLNKAQATVKLKRKKKLPWWTTKKSTFNCLVPKQPFSFFSMFWGLLRITVSFLCGLERLHFFNASSAAASNAFSTPSPFWAEHLKTGIFSCSPHSWASLGSTSRLFKSILLPIKMKGNLWSFKCPITSSFQKDFALNESIDVTS